MLCVGIVVTFAWWPHSFVSAQGGVNCHIDGEIERDTQRRRKLPRLAMRASLNGQHFRISFGEYSRFRVHAFIINDSAAQVNRGSIPI